jgi:DNA mismatch repair ATPase MutS
LPLGISGSFSKKVNKKHMEVSRTSAMLSKYGKLLYEIEKAGFSSEIISDFKESLKTDDATSSLEIKKLSSILNALDNRLNFVSWVLFNGFMLWDILQMLRLEHWQTKHHDKLENWFDVIAETEILISLANFSYNNPEAEFPKLQNSGFIFKAEKLGHPLISKTDRVDNEVEIKTTGFSIITGANMAGKSTYLRTVGINLILGMIGAPVCGKGVTLNPVRLYTSIRTDDSLQKNESYFYSELKRLKAIIDELKRGTKLFIILDEILRGTNSKDKHAGSEALLKQLIDLKTAGIIATHDVALGILEKSFPDHIRNSCFEVDIDGSELSFDYKLRDGVSKNMNATILMREMGITV